MLVAAAVVPSPPILVPAIASGADRELDDLRAAIGKALRMVAASEPDLLVCVGTGPTAARFAAGARGTFRGFGVPLEVRLGVRAADDADGRDQRALPSSLAVVAWLLAEYGWSGPVVGEAVTEDLLPSEAERSGQRLVGQSERVALLVAGDGSAALSDRSPGFVRPGAEQWQAAATKALASADQDQLQALTVVDGQRFMAAGRGPWQVLAGAAAGSGVAWRGHVLADESPYGVAYVVAVWERAQA